MTIEAMKLALDALTYIHAETSTEEDELIDRAITALRTAIEQAEKQEPYGYFRYDMRLDAWVQSRADKRGVAFYTTPPAAPVEPDHGNELTIAYMGGVHLGKELAAQRQWVGLTDAEIEEWDYDVRDVVMDIEKLLREKNT